jgi:DNA-binding PadR family transcriptional regulator
MAHATQKQGHRKAKKSYTLSPASVAFLDALRKKRRASSASSVLEDILQTVRRGYAKKALERAVADYYDSLPADEAAEQARWGEFATREFPNEPA